MCDAKIELMRPLDETPITKLFKYCTCSCLNTCIKRSERETADTAFDIRENDHFLDKVIELSPKNGKVLKYEGTSYEADAYLFEGIKVKKDEDTRRDFSSTKK